MAKLSIRHSIQLLIIRIDGGKLIACLLFYFPWRKGQKKSPPERGGLFYFNWVLEFDQNKSLTPILAASEFM
jgi:hypothetical protein